MNVTDRPATTRASERGYNRSAEKTHFLTNFHRYKSLVARKSWIPAMCVLAGLVSVWSLSWYGPPTFVSVGRMIVNARISVQEQESTTYTEEMNNFLGTQASLMQSEQVIRRALARVALRYPEFAGHAQASAGGASLVKLRVTITPKTSIFTLSGTGSDPQVTQTFTKYCMEEYVTLKKEMRGRQSDIAVAALTEEMHNLERTNNLLDQAQADFESTNSMALFEEQSSSVGNYLSAMNQRLAALTSEYELLQSLTLDQSLERWQQMGTALPIVDDLTGRLGPYQSASGSVDELATDYLRAKQQLLLLKADQQELGQYLRAPHPKMVAMDDEIARGQSLLDIYRQQGLEQLESRTNSLALQIRNMERQIKLWNVRGLEVSKKLAEYHRLKAKTQRYEGIYDHMFATMTTLDISKEATPETVTIMEEASSAEEGRPSLNKLVADRKSVV